MNNHIVDEWVKACESYTQYDLFRKYPLDDRLYRLFSVACCREVWDKLTDERSRKAIEAAELYADGLVSEKELRKACNDAWIVYSYNCSNGDAVSVYTSAFAYTASGITASAATAVACSVFTKRYKQRGLILASMYPIDFNDNWVNPTTTALAHNIYDKKDFSLMPILADALQDVDCNEEILNHLRSPGPFYKGNYVIDVLTGKRTTKASAGVTQAYDAVSTKER